MKSEFGKDSTERQMFVDFWNLSQRYWIPEDSDEYWSNLLYDVEEFANKYKDTCRLGMYIATDLICFLEEKNKK